MKIYLAARYGRHPEMQIHAGELEKYGHKVTSRWIQGDHELRANGPDVDTVNRKFAIEDLNDLVHADYILSFSDEGRMFVEKPSRGGRHVEFGIGIALNKGLGLIGQREHIFHYFYHVEVYDTFTAWLADHKGS